MNDLTIYDREADGWWDPANRTFASLRTVARSRLTHLIEVCGSPAGRDVIDLGCGGGFYSVPLAELGARVVGIDRSLGSVRAARNASDVPRFICADITAVPLSDASADLIIAGDVLEHVPGYRAVFSEAARLLRRDGTLFVSTINRTRRAALVGVTLAERIGLIPRGTHDPRHFISPRELAGAARACGLETVLVQGERPAFFATLRNWSIHLVPARDTSISYFAVFRKPVSSLQRS